MPVALARSVIFYIKTLTATCRLFVRVIDTVEHKWTMRRERLSPQYTTKWGDLPIVRC
ncbi:DUF4113 domain-containing protein [Vibrio sp. S11_S32]|nr:DUF4113 domain-containing protein [Vibrio sp. S11_S32]